MSDRRFGELRLRMRAKRQKLRKQVDLYVASWFSNNAPLEDQAELEKIICDYGEGDKKAA